MWVEKMVIRPSFRDRSRFFISSATTTSRAGQRLVQEQDVGLGDDVDQHLHLVLHAVGVVLQELVPVLRGDAHFLEVFIQGPGIPDGVGIDVQKNLRNSRPVRNSGTVGVERTYPMSSAATSRRTPFSSR